MNRWRRAIHAFRNVSSIQDGGVWGYRQPWTVMRWIRYTFEVNKFEEEYHQWSHVLLWDAVMCKARAIRYVWRAFKR